MRSQRYSVSYMKYSKVYEVLNDEEKERFECTVDGSIKKFEIYSDEIDDWFEVNLERHFRLYPKRMEKITDQIIIDITKYINDEILNVADMKIDSIKESW